MNDEGQEILPRIQGPADLKALGPAEVARLAAECRRRIVSVITERGGHLASNLGVVELTLALHRVFDSPTDRIVWDTSNQTYTHKLVTGRQARFSTIRQPGGLSGFAEPAESPHDVLAAGHAGTGLSFALGVSAASQPDGPWTVAVVGDGALTSGLSYEALNNAVHLRPRRFVVVFNDNGWSISENVGWLARATQRLTLGPRYGRWVTAGERLFGALPGGGAFWSGLRRLKNYAKGLLTPGLVWEEVGLHYIGPVDGHDQGELERALGRARDVSERHPVVLHVRTHKGRGLEEAEKNPVRFHQPSSPVVAAAGGRQTYSEVFSRAMIRIMEEDPRVVALSAAMLEGTGLAAVRRRFPGRVHDVGIAESHAVTMAAGMARAGLRPVVCIYSTFLQRSYDQVLHDVALQKLPVTLAIDRAGLIGDDGKTHQGVFDTAFLRHFPDIVLAAPRDEGELPHLLWTAVRGGRPFALRYPRGLGVGTEPPFAFKDVPVGRGETLQDGKDAALACFGAVAGPALEAAAALSARGLSVRVLDCRFAKPVDAELLKRAASECGRVLTVEEHAAAGGFGSAVLEALAPLGLAGRVRVHGVGDAWVEQAPQAAQRAAAGLDAAGIAARLLEAFPELAALARPA